VSSGEREDVGKNLKRFEGKNLWVKLDTNGYNENAAGTRERLDVRRRIPWEEKGERTSGE